MRPIKCNKSPEQRTRSLSSDSEKEYWVWLLVSFFFLFTVDVFTTLVASGLYGPQNEINPLLRWSLHQGMEVFVIVHIVACIIATLLFDVLLNFVERNKIHPFIFESWLGMIVSGSFIVGLNNMFTLLIGVSLYRIVYMVFPALWDLSLKIL
jgi:hypothetical protein